MSFRDDEGALRELERVLADRDAALAQRQRALASFEAEEQEEVILRNALSVVEHELADLTRKPSTLSLRRSITIASLAEAFSVLVGNAVLLVVALGVALFVSIMVYGMFGRS